MSSQSDVSSESVRVEEKCEVRSISQSHNFRAICRADTDESVNCLAPLSVVQTGACVLSHGVNSGRLCDLCELTETICTYLGDVCPIDFLIESHDRIYSSGLPNFMGCRIPVFSKINIPFFGMVCVVM
jgi:hypothetical protein